MQGTIIHTDKDEKRIGDTGRKDDTSHRRRVMDAHDGGLYIAKVLLKKMRDEGGRKKQGTNPDAKVTVSRTGHAIVMDDAGDGHGVDGAEVFLGFTLWGRISAGRG